MGGDGSGLAYGQAKKLTVESCHGISTAWLKNNGYLNGSIRCGRITWSRGGRETGSVNLEVLTDEYGGYIRFQYTSTNRFTGQKTNHDYKARLTVTPCNFGGVRFWFRCPCCLNRVGCLYLAHSEIFGCRRCNGLAYDSQSENRSGTYGHLWRVIKLDKEYETLRKQVKRRFYNGRPTRQHRRLMAFQRRLGTYLDSPLVREFLGW